MTIIYLSPKGDDQNSGHSFAEAKRSVSAALAEIQDGDTLKFEVGDYEGFTVEADVLRKKFTMKPDDPATENVADEQLVREAGDVVVTEETEPITEPKGAAKGMTRVTKIIETSAAQKRRVVTKIIYREPPESKAWGAVIRRDVAVEVVR